MTTETPEAPETSEENQAEQRAEADREVARVEREKFEKRKTAEVPNRIPSAKETREKLEEYKRSQLKKEKHADADPRTLRQRLSEGDTYAALRIALAGLAMLGHIFRGAKDADLAKRSVGCADALLEELDK